jgi:hypothetical protein
MCINFYRSIVSKPLTSAPERLQRMLLRLQRYTIQLVFKPSSEVIVAECLSRVYPANSALPMKFEEELAILIDDQQAAEIRMVASKEALDRIKRYDDDIHCASETKNHRLAH